VIVVDSSVWIDFFNGVGSPEVERLDGLLGVTPLAIGDLILVEVMQGFRNGRDVATACIQANLPLLFSGRDFVPYVEHLGLEAA
jgi:predicted nucleic acid-binding protein